MKNLGLSLLACTALLALLCRQEAGHPVSQADAAAAAMAAEAPVLRASQPGPEVQKSQGFAEVGTAFRRGTPSSADQLGQAEARARSDAQAHADDRATTQADTVPADAPREQ